MNRQAFKVGLLLPVVSDIIQEMSLAAFLPPVFGAWCGNFKVRCTCPSMYWSNS